MDALSGARSLLPLTLAPADASATREPSGAGSSALCSSERPFLLLEGLQLTSAGYAWNRRRVSCVSILRRGARMKTIGLVVLLLAASVCAFAADQGFPCRYEQAFNNNGHVSMELGGGDYEVRAGAADKIVVTCSTETVEQNKKVEVRFVGGKDSTKLKVHGPHNNFS